jgi:hypothetical protein
MWRTITTFVVIAAWLGAAACGDKKAKPADQAASAQKAVGSNAATAQAGSGSGSGAGSAEANEPVLFNRLDVERYDDEKIVDHVPLKVKVPKVAAYRGFPGGALVTALAQGTEVIQLASRSGFYRVTFPDPEHADRRLMGWVAGPAFEAPPKLAKKYDAARCTIFDGGPGTQVYAIENDGRAAACEYVCRDASECESTGGKCELRMYIDKLGTIPDVWQYSTVCPLPSLVSNGPPELIGNQPPVNGRCPHGQSVVPRYGGGCYRVCKKDLDCPQGSTCRAFDKLKVKTKLCST